MIVITLARFLGLYFYYCHPRKIKLQNIIFTIGSTLSALFWGILASILIVNDTLFHQMIVIIIIAGVTAGGVQSLNANLTASLFFIVLIIAPLCVWLLLKNHLSYVLVGTAMLIYLLFMISLCIRGYRLLDEFLRLLFENQILVENLSITNEKLVDANKILEHREHDIVLINKMNDLLQTSKELVDSYDIMTFTAKKLFADFNGGIILCNPVTKKLETLNQWGKNPVLKAQISHDDCWAIRKGQIYCVDENHPEILCKHFTSTPASTLCLPLLNQNGLMGLIVLHSINKVNFTEYQLQLASSFSEVIQLSLTNISLRELLYQQSTQDPLTGLYNRRFMDEILTKELQICLREQKSLSVAMIDLDRFKQFNDVNGHEAGDECLKVMAQLIKQTFRESDIPCRFGGEEFLIVLLNSTLAESFHRLEEFRKRVKKEIVFFNGIQLPPITLSIGIAEAPLQGETATKIIGAADKALYLAKKSRDKTVKFKSSKDHKPGNHHETSR